MHIIQIQTIGAWKCAQERPGKTILVVFSNFSSLLQGMGRDFNGMRGNSQPQTHLLLGYQLYIEQWNMCLTNMTAGMVPWYGLTVPWLKAEKVWFMSSCTPFINQTITEEVPCFREGNHQDWRGIQISVLVCHSVFFQRSTYRLKCNVFKFDIFPNSFTIFRGLCAFSRH